MSEVLRVENLGLKYGDKQILKHFTLHLNKGECLSLLGESGCGKTSALRAIAGLINPSEGKIHLGDREVFGAQGGLPPQKRNIGLVFQDYALFPHLSVRQNIVFGLYGQSAESIEKRCKGLLQLIRLTEHAEKLPSQLSGGQQQRVALARALAPRPAIILMDEPFANIDSNLKLNLGLALKEILHQEAATALLVTHDRNDALALSDRIAIMNHSDNGGFVEQVGRPDDVYRRPISPVAARLTGESLIFSGTANHGRIQTSLGEFEINGDFCGNALIIERPDAFQFQHDAHGPLEVIGVHYSAGSRRAVLQHGDQRWVAPCPDNTACGDRFSIEARRPLWFVQQ